MGDVLYPGGVEVSGPEHTALQFLDQHPQGGAHTDATLALLAQKDEQDAAAEADAAAADAEAAKEEEDEDPSEAPKTEQFENGSPPSYGGFDPFVTGPQAVSSEASPAEAPEVGQNVEDVTPSYPEVAPESPADVPTP